jgi:enamine deaminase RidA (YjgF/YER057c/UK114 family)
MYHLAGSPPGGDLIAKRQAVGTRSSCQNRPAERKFVPQSPKGENMSDVRRIDPGPRLSEASVHGGRLYLSGMIPEDTSLDITG